MNQRKWLVILSLFVALALVLGACGGNDNEGASGNDAVETPPQSSDAEGNNEDKGSEPKEDVTITFYSTNWDPVELFDFRFGDALREKFPEYKIEYIQRGAGTHPEELIATGTEFDIFFQAISFYESHTMPLDLHYDMTELIEQSGVDLDRYEPTTIDAIKQLNGGKMYSLPVYGNTLVLFYNQDVFDQFGLDYPTNDMTWEETMEIAKRITRVEDEVQYIGLTHYPTLTTRMNPMSIPTIDMESGQPTINTDDRWKTFYEMFFVNPVAEGYQDWLNEVTPGAMPNAFYNLKNIGMYAGMVSTLAIANPELENFEWDLVALPSFADNPGVGAQINSINFGITKLSSEKEEAMEVIKYMGSDEFQMQLSRKAVMPVIKNQEVREAFGKESPHGEKNYQALFYKDPAPVPEKTYYDADMVSIYQAEGVEVMLGNKDVNTARRDAHELAVQKLEELKKANE